jgi:superfamily I DNA/RNA helicase
LLPVTFTNVAAEDLQRELLQIGVDGCQEIRGFTLHALGMRILRRQNVLEATGRVARPLNQFEREPLLYDLGNRFGNKRERAKKIRAYEAAWARLQHQEPGYALDEADQVFEQHLLEWLRFHRGMLIGEIIPIVYQYLRDNPAAPECHLYDAILVDEYQDLNRAEQAVIDLLRGEAELCIVGDDDQSLYSFKHAHPAGIRMFGETHADSADHQMEECRRCPTRIVHIANSLISHNRDREGRQLSAVEANGPGNVELVQFNRLEDEAAGVAAFVRDQIDHHAYLPQDILVLAQRRAIGNPIHAALIARNVPSKSYYEEGELDSDAAQERLAIFKLYINPEDRIALRWLLGRDSSDFRASAYARVREYCEQTGLSPWSVLSSLADGSINIRYTASLVGRFRQITASLALLRDDSGHEEDIQGLIQRWLPEEMAGLTELRELVLGLADASETAADLLFNLTEAIATPEIPPDVTQVRIMSLHKSKGLSSPVVVIAGCIEGLLPAAPDPDLSPAAQQASLEEQRRLMYVGLTRVKAEPGAGRPGVLLLTYSRRMDLADAMGSGIQPARVVYADALVIASRFLREFGPSAPRPRAG